MQMVTYYLDMFTTASTLLFFAEIWFEGAPFFFCEFGTPNLVKLSFLAEHGHAAVAKLQVI
jgi:hypothetical protein